MLYVNPEYFLHVNNNKTGKQFFLSQLEIHKILIYHKKSFCLKQITKFKKIKMT